MTYAELYGDIKKRPLKCGLGNKMIGNVGGFDARDIFGTNKFVEAGDAMSRTSVVASPIAKMGLGIVSEMSNPFDDLTVGMTMPSL